MQAIERWASRGRQSRGGRVAPVRLTSLIAALALAGAGGVALAGCGAEYPDLMVVTRSGELPAARLELLVNDGGDASCNGGTEHRLSPRLLLDARDVVRSLTEETLANEVLPPSPRALLRFRLRTEDGSVTFSDVDGARDPDLGRLLELTREIAQDVCGLPR
jgi:hypothetical protein